MQYLMLSREYRESVCYDQIGKSASARSSFLNSCTILSLEFLGTDISGKNPRVIMRHSVFLFKILKF